MRERSPSGSGARPWRRAALWLSVLGPLFFLAYGVANWITSLREDVTVVVFDWERLIPFVPWTIVPYWSIDALYAVSLFLCRDRRELDTHGRRLLLATVISIAGFLAFPLRFSFQRPAVDGVLGALFDLLGTYDRPFNQAPSLHVSLLVVLWVKYSEHLRGHWRWLLHAWFALIGVSVLTTYQHHFVDVVTGFWAGVLCLYLAPDGGWPRSLLARESGSGRVGAVYLLAATTTGAAAVGLAGWGWLLLWPAAALGAVAAAYLAFGPAVFQKNAGRHSFAASVLLAPYLVGAWVSQRVQNRRTPPWVEITGNVRLGRLPRYDEITARAHRAVLDLTGEFASPAARREDIRYHNLPLMDLVPPAPRALRDASEFIDAARREGPVLVHCGLGLGRSVAVVAAWLVASGNAATAADALARIRRVRPKAVVNERVQAAICLAARTGCRPLGQSALLALKPSRERAC